MYEPKWQEHMKIIESTIFSFEKIKDCLSHFYVLVFLLRNKPRNAQQQRKNEKKRHTANVENKKNIKSLRPINIYMWG